MAMSTKGGIQVNRKICLNKFPLKVLSLYLLKELLFWYWMRIFTDQVLLLCDAYWTKKIDLPFSMSYMKMIFFSNLFSGINISSWWKHLTPRCLDHSILIILADRKFLSEIWKFTGWPYALSLWHELCNLFSCSWL